MVVAANPASVSTVWYLRKKASFEFIQENGSAPNYSLVKSVAIKIEPELLGQICVWDWVEVRYVSIVSEEDLVKWVTIFEEGYIRRELNLLQILEVCLRQWHWLEWLREHHLN